MTTEDRPLVTIHIPNNNNDDYHITRRDSDFDIKDILQYTIARTKRYTLTYKDGVLNISFRIDKFVKYTENIPFCKFINNFNVSIPDIDDFISFRVDDEYYQVHLVYKKNTGIHYLKYDCEGSYKAITIVTNIKDYSYTTMGDILIVMYRDFNGLYNTNLTIQSFDLNNLNKTDWTEFREVDVFNRNSIPQEDAINISFKYIDNRTLECNAVCTTNPDHYFKQIIVLYKHYIGTINLHRSKRM